MSEISSTSELTTKEIVEQAIKNYHNTILPYLKCGNGGYSDTPIGAVTFFNDTEAPDGWLACDGSIYNISDYPYLAAHYERVYGSKNHYGGDGITTFAVQNDQGEFLRGAGTNSHANQGSGGEVGEHQDGTEIPNVWFWGNQWFGIGSSGNNTGTYNDAKVENADYLSNGGYKAEISFNDKGTASNIGRYTPRPTNTSYLICVKAVPAGILYDGEEHEVGTWFGETLYQKTIELSNLSSNNTTWQEVWNGQDCQIIDARGWCVDNNGIGTMLSSNIPNDITFIPLIGSNRSKLSVRTYRANSTSFNGQITIQYTKTTD